MLKQPDIRMPGGQSLDPRAHQFRITEIFHSLQGEARDVGWPTVFIRLTGCPLRCVYCDTTYSFTGGHTMDLGEVLDAVAAYDCRHVCVTGGEPLAQKTCPILLKALCDEGYEVSLETSGAMDVSPVDPRVVKVMDLKTPSSGEEGKNYLRNLDFLCPRDQVKFVIQDRRDYDWSVQLMQEHDLGRRFDVLFSPVADDLAPGTLADWILHDRLPVRFQIQLHKYLWGDEKGR